MSIIEAINQVDAQIHNTCTEAEKRGWLSTLDGLVQALLFGAQEAFSGYGESDEDTQLKIPAPFDEVYLYWLEGKIHYANGDFTRFNNANAMFAGAWQRYAAFVHRSGGSAAENCFY